MTAPLWMLAALTMPAITSIACAYLWQKRLARRVLFFACGLLGGYVAFGLTIGISTLFAYLALRASAYSLGGILTTYSPAILLPWVPSLLIVVVSRRYRERKQPDARTGS
jgi:hypothetical protein